MHNTAANLLWYHHDTKQPLWDIWLSTKSKLFVYCNATREVLSHCTGNRHKNLVKFRCVIPESYYGWSTNFSPEDYCKHARWHLMASSTVISLTQCHRQNTRMLQLPINTTCANIDNRQSGVHLQIAFPVLVISHKSILSSHFAWTDISTSSSPALILCWCSLNCLMAMILVRLTSWVSVRVFI